MLSMSSDINGNPNATLKSDDNKSLYHYLNKILDISEAQLTCSICSDLMENPSTITCGHTFCNGCIHDWFKTKENCPCCRLACPGGERSSPIIPMEEYLSVIKPLIVTRDKEQYTKVINLRKSLSEVITPEPSKTEIPELSNLFETDQDLKRIMKEYLFYAETEKDFKSIQTAITLVKCAIATKNDTGSEYCEFLNDLNKLECDEDRILVFDKYLSHPSLSDNEHQYMPKQRLTKVTLEWPTLHSWIQMLALLFMGTVIYCCLEGLEEEGFNLISDPMLRAMPLLNVYIEIFDYFR